MIQYGIILVWNLSVDGYVLESWNKGSTKTLYFYARYTYPIMEDNLRRRIKMKNVIAYIKKHLKKFIVGVVLFVVTLGGSLLYKCLKKEHPQEEEL